MFCIAICQFHIDFGFAARPSADQVGALTYCCAHCIDIYSIPDEANPTPTLITTVMVRLVLEEDFNYFSQTSTTPRVTMKKKQNKLFTSKTFVPPI